MSEPRKGVRALVLQHEVPTPGGLVSDWLVEQDAVIDTYRIDESEREIEPADYDMIVSLGSEFAAFDDHIAWIGREAKLLERALEDDVPVLGICFGGQLMAQVLGARTWRGEQSEVGWLPVRSENSELVPEGPWFQWHFDTFTLPDGADPIADSPVGLQAYTYGRSLGVQFHPEVTPAIMDEWVRIYRHELDQVGADPDELVEETRRVQKSARERAWKLFGSWRDRVAGIGRERARGG